MQQVVAFCNQGEEKSSVRKKQDEAFSTNFVTFSSILSQ